jgi:hypothetical protein
MRVPQAAPARWSLAVVPVALAIGQCEQDREHGRRKLRHQAAPGAARRRGSRQSCLARATSRSCARRSASARARPAPVFGQAVVAATLVVECRIRALVGLGDHAIDKQLTNGPVQRARTEPHLAATEAGNLAHDVVPVALAIGQCEQDIEHGRRKRRPAVSIHRGYGDGVKE